MTQFTYEFGTYEETVDGKNLRVFATGKYDCDAQAELQVSLLADRSDEFDFTDIDGELLTGLTIRRGDTEWFKAFGNI